MLTKVVIKSPDADTLWASQLWAEIMALVRGDGPVSVIEIEDISITSEPEHGTEDRDDLYGNIAGRVADAVSMELSDRWPDMISLEVAQSVQFSLTRDGVECLARFIRKACDQAVDATLKAKGLTP